MKVSWDMFFTEQKLKRNNINRKIHTQIYTLKLKEEGYKIILDNTNQPPVIREEGSVLLSEVTSLSKLTRTLVSSSDRSYSFC